jgi:hypothetical protein
MSANSSLPKVADQIITYNKNVVDILSKINSLTTTTDASVNLQIFDESGVLRNFSLPSFTSLKNEIDRLNNNINSLYSIDSSGATIQPTNKNNFKKLITVDLNKEPAPINSVGSISNFKTQPNWFFDSLVDPMLNIEIDLSGKIEDDVRKCMARRYIVEFARDTEGNLTTLGQSALTSFNELFRGNANIILSEFEEWHRTTPGLIEPFNPKYDEQVFDLQPNSLLYDGEFNVLKIQEDRLNAKLWYVLNTLDYVTTDTNEVRQLSIDDELIINKEKSSTRYKIIEVSTSESNPRVVLERVEGLEPIPVGVGTLKIYSPVIYTKNVRISVGYNERNVTFIKPINTENNLVAKKWSLGTGYFTNDLRLESDSDANGLSMEQFYIDYVYDYGEILKDLVSKKTPNKLAGVPNSPTLNEDNFKVVQVNTHLTSTPDANLLKQKHNQQLALKSEIEQLQDSIIDRNKKAKVAKFKSDSFRKQAKIELEELSRKRVSKAKLLRSVTREIIDVSQNPRVNIAPKYRVRGFWSIPEPVLTRGTKPQEIVQFRVQYRYVSTDGTEAPVEQYQVDSNDNKASFSNWQEMKTDARKRVYDAETDSYFWEIQDLESADTPNINQVDIPIQVGERVEFRIKSISEVGWPESPVESDWSDILSVDFPDDLNNVLNDSDFILQEATKEDLKATVETELSAKGLDDHLSDQITINSKTYYHDSTTILSGFKDSNGVSLDLFEYLKSLEDKIRSLEEQISRAQGELEVAIFRDNQEFIISNGSETAFNINCEDYLNDYDEEGVPNGRVYGNDIYVIKDFVVRVRNNASSSPLGLLSGRTYTQSPEVYNSGAPQTFWVNERDELLTSDVTGQTRTQLPNQFIWMVNYDSISTNSVTKLTENIGNSFVGDNNNSITSILASDEYNLGYSESGVLNFIGNNKSLLDPSKWVDTVTSVASSNKLLSSIHPVVKDLESITETNSEKVKTVKPGEENDIIIPLNIYFKMNALDNTQTGENYNYINLNRQFKTVRHIKKVKFLLENEAENRPFVFTIKFTLNRNNVVFKQQRRRDEPLNKLIR